MDTDVVEQSGVVTPDGGEAVAGGDVLDGTVESTIDEVDHLLDEVEAALTRLDEGTYGTCGICGSAIDDASLSADPTVRNCGVCEGTDPGSSSPDDAVGELAGGVVGDQGADSGDQGAESGHREADTTEAFDTETPPWSGRGHSED